MSSLFDNLAYEIFQILKGYGMTLSLYGMAGEAVYEPKRARRMFAQPHKIMVSIVEMGSDSEVKIYLSSTTDLSEVNKIIGVIRKITTRYNVLLNVRKFGKELSPKDFAYQAVTEAAMWGSTKSSYQKVGDTKMIVRHTSPVKEGIMGSRSRNILSIFVETKEGERFKFPFNNLKAGRAFAQHINQGGNVHDSVGRCIAEMAEEYIKISSVNSYAYRSRNVLGESAGEIRATIKGRLTELRKVLETLSRPKGYWKLKEELEQPPVINESQVTEIALEAARLGKLLMIDDTHALAENISTVAKLTLGGKMTERQKMFHGVLVVENEAADALVEALLDEYGYAEESFSRFGGNIAFNEEQSFNEAQDVLNMLEFAYQISESDEVETYARDWSEARLKASDYQGRGDGEFADNKEQTAFNAGVIELADGIRDILSGKIQTPDYPERAPTFSESDATAKMRFYLDLYVSGSSLNVPTANYVSAIIDKMAENKKLDSAESLIAQRLYDALEDDLFGESVIEADNPWDTPDGAATPATNAIESIVTEFDVDDFVGGEWSEVIDQVPMDEPLTLSEVKKRMIETIQYQVEKHYDIKVEAYQVEDIAEILFDEIVKFIEQSGTELVHDINEFAGDDNGPQGPRFDVGDKVATDRGHGIVISSDGQFVSIEYLHGGMETLEAGTVDLIEGLSQFAEEGELAAWFDSFVAENVVGGNLKSISSDDISGKSLHVGDRVMHKVYGLGEVVETSEKFTKVAFDQPHSRLPESQTVTVSTGILQKPRTTLDIKSSKNTVTESDDGFTGSVWWEVERDGEWTEVEVEFYRSADEDMRMGSWDDPFGSPGSSGNIEELTSVGIQLTDAEFAEVREYLEKNWDSHIDESTKLDELSIGTRDAYLTKAATQRGELEKAELEMGDERAAAKRSRRERGLGTLFNKAARDVKAAKGLDESADEEIFSTTLEIENAEGGYDEIEVDVYFEYEAATRDRFDEPGSGATVSISKVVNSETGEEIKIDEADDERLRELIIDDMVDADDGSAQDDYYDRYRDDLMDDQQEPKVRKLGGDRGRALLKSVSIEETLGELSDMIPILAEGELDFDAIDDVMNTMREYAQDIIMRPGDYHFELNDSEESILPNRRFKDLLTSKLESLLGYQVETPENMRKPGTKLGGD